MGCCYSAARSMRGDEPPQPSKWKPLEKRSCTDIIPLIVFTLFFIGMMLIAGFAIVNGAAYRMINGFDSYGNVCSKKNSPISSHPLSGLDQTGKPYVFFMNVANGYKSLEICVSKCPDRELYSMNDVHDFFLETGSQLCDYSLPPDQYLSSAAASSTTGPCPVFPVLRSSQVLYRCVPDNIGTFLIDLLVNSLNPVNRIISDIYLCRYSIMGLCFLSLFVAFVVVLLLRYLASVVVYIINIVVVISSIAGTSMLWWMYATSLNSINTAPPEKLAQSKADSQALLWYSIGATVVTVVLLLLILVMRKRVALTVDLFHEAGKCMVHMPALMIQPLWTFLVLLMFWMGWVVVFGFIAFSGTKVMDPIHPGWVRYNATAPIHYMWWYHVVGLVWVSEFILACQQMVIAGAVAKHYFTRDKKKLGAPIISSMGRLISNHLGSCALGSFIIILVKIPRCILMYLSRQIKDSPNMLAKLMVKCCICCLWVLEKCLRYLNYNAYSLVAINGTHFCKSACDAVATLLSNALRVIAINSVGAFVLFLGKLLVVAIVAGVGGILVVKFHPNVNYIAAPVGLIAVFSYLTAHCFISIYEMSIDTLLLCFCEDSRVNDGTPGKEYFMPKSLMTYVKNSSKHISKLEGKPHKNSENEESMRLESPNA
ncbi:choline transporter-like protein 1 [Ciona intestinalis]